MRLPVLIILLTGCLSLPGKCQLLRSVDIEFTYTAGGQQLRKTWQGPGEDPQDGLYKPEHYDIVVKLNEGVPAADYYVEVLVEEKISRSAPFAIDGTPLPEGWVPVRVVYSGPAAAAKQHTIVVKDPAYQLVYDTGSLLYTRDAVRIVVVSRHNRTQKITYVKREYEYPM